MLNESSFLLLTPIALLAASTLFSAPFKGRAGNYVSSALSTAASAVMCYVSLSTLLYNARYQLSVQLYGGGGTSPGFPSGFATLVFRVDELSAVFVMILGVVGLTSSLYGFSYIGRFVGREHIGFYGLNYSLFLLSMYAVLISYDLFWFIVFWEVMTISSQFLVSYEKGKDVAVRAGFKYFCMAKAGSEAIVVSVVMAVIALTGMNTSFEPVKAFTKGLASANPALANAIIAALFVGLSVKAALVPLHTWLPDAHPEAPSNVSALLSGVMIKTSVYMMFRLFLYFFTPTTHWGLIVATVGTVTLLAGTMYALLQTDSKRLLAFHSVGQMGYIVLALGAALTLYSMGGELPAMLASVALAASLYHAVNHALFKSLLFLTAGSVVYATGSRNLDVLGGLARAMPATSVAALIASLSISGIPPFNGFVSKWLIYSSTIPSSSILSVYGVVALFISGVTAASFVKYYTTIFSKPPRARLEGVREVPPPMIASQLILSALCLLLGVLPAVALTLVAPVLRMFNLLQYLRLAAHPAIVFIDVDGVAANSPLLLAVVVGTLALSVGLGLRTPRPPRLGVWSCGVRFDKYLMNVPGASYLKPFEEAFQSIYSFGSVLHKYFVRELSRAFMNASRRASVVIESPAVMLAAFLATALMLLAWAGGGW